ncbi:hypothetical protein [Kitasatospora viridis]|uniref:Uncharacterized protein n=1 Tax=Kitasatospora viridis TaxID=281105 RepID=A0A561UL01_9ACTN|nr:hypothetical protein [Kitasatospora viridis]TWG00048.1 hypothetical protein FHX73_113914 [Kitasatospora viridis]
MLRSGGLRRCYYCGAGVERAAAVRTFRVGLRLVVVHDRHPRGPQERK